MEKGMLVCELIELLQALQKSEGNDARVVLVEDQGDRYGVGVSLVSSRMANVLANGSSVSEEDRLMHEYFGGEYPLW